MEVIFELLFGIIHWLSGSLFSGDMRREVKALQAKCSHAKETGVPLICDIPASLRIYQLSKRGRRHGKWTRGILHVQATSLIWEPRPGEQGRSWDLATATIIREVPPIGGSSRYQQGRNLLMQSGHHSIELHIRQPFLPFLRAGQEQAAGRIVLWAHGNGARSCSRIR